MNLVDLKHATQILSAALGCEIPPSNALHRLSTFRDFEQGNFQVLRTLVNLEMLEMLPCTETGHEWIWHGLLTKLLELEERPDDAAVPALRQFAEEELRQRPIGLTADYCVARFLMGLRARLDVTSVFTTGAGFIGVGPRHMEPGDRIVFPFGMRCPFVVRPLNPECTGRTNIK